MNRQRQCNTQAKQHQHGAVAIIVALCLVVLVGMLGLVLDLGHLYIAKTELQNAADAAALSGAERLNGTADRICCAADSAQMLAIEAARRNSYDLNSKEVAITAANLWVGSCPDQDRPGDPDTDGCTMVPISSVTSDALAVDKTFLQVDTDPAPAGLGRSLSTWFIQVLPGASNSTVTFGMAVAGRYTTPITPIGVCSLRDAREAWVKYDSGVNDEYKVEFGYMRGVNYDLQDINKESNGLASGTELYIHPTATPDTGCNPAGGNADFSAPFLCTGRSAIATTFGSTVYTNTGLAAGKSIAAINTRFDQYGPPLDASLDHTVCAPDANIKQYTPAVVPPSWMTSIPPPLPSLDQSVIYGLADWLAGPVGGGLRSTLPSVPPSVLVAEKENKGGCENDCSNNYGVLWSYTRPEKKSGNFTPSDWAVLYPSSPKELSSPAYVPPSPYRYGLANTGDSTYFELPIHTGSTIPEPRRILNVLIIDCPASVGGICAPLTVLGVGKFFMQRDASVSGWITGEFAGLVPESELTSVIRLYR